MTLLEHCAQIHAKLLVDQQVDEEVGQVVDVVGVAEVAADWLFRVDCVDGRSEGKDEDEEQTETDLHRLRVARFSNIWLSPKKM